MSQPTLHNLHRPIGSTGLMVSPLGLGTVKLGRDQGVKYPNGFTIPDDAAARELLAQSVSATTGKNISPSAVTKIEDTYPALDAWAKQLRERADQAFAKPASSH